MSLDPPAVIYQEALNWEQPRGKIMFDFDVSKLFAVEGLVVVVTGGGTGIGLCRVSL